MLLNADGADRTDLAAIPQHPLEVNLQLEMPKLQSLLVWNWKVLLRHFRNEIENELDVSDELLNELLKLEVMNITVWEVIKVSM